MVKYTDCSEYYEAEAVALGDTMGKRVEAEALARLATTGFESYVKLNKKVPPEVPRRLSLLISKLHPPEQAW